MKQRRNAEMEASAEYQRKKAMGHDARVREGVEVLAKQLHERDKYNDETASYDRARRKAEETFNKTSRKHWS